MVLIDYKPRSNGLLSGQRHLDGAVILSISGEVDLSNASSLQGCLITATETGKHLVVVDLKDLRYIDVSGINVLLNVTRTSAHIGCSIVLAAVPPMVRRILGILGLEQAIPVLSTVETALDGKAKPGAGKQSPAAPTSP